MKTTTSIVLALIISIASLGQSAQKNTALTDSSVIKIPDIALETPEVLGHWLKKNTPNHYEAVKALYYWMGDHIFYDVRLLRMVMSTEPGKHHPYKDTVDAAIKTLSSRGANCQGYTSLFFEVCRYADIPVDFISGYTYKHGQVDLDASHAWIGIKLNGHWGIIDPTWGAGTVDDKSRFAFNFNWRNFMIPPETAIFTHVPFDPIYQYLDHPIKPAEIRDQTTTEALKRPAVNFEDTLAAVKKEAMLTQIQGRLRRMQELGVINPLQEAEVKVLTSNIPAANYATDKASGAESRYRALIDRYNKLVHDSNDFSSFMSKGMKPAKTNKEIIDWMDRLCKEGPDIITALNGLTFQSPEITQNCQHLISSVQSLSARLQDTRKQVTDYLNKKA
ncbi:transglutaminase domain-containing protein [Chitinophaga sp. Cy-1792]|uniref:transglutaminase domain-containing protein n=1 Tax=Chitinophaga sp. Cy-1792 TaxID=2608339 RepID=UPI00142246B6|nr:transglutaminase domain-containing protein [Chitinophaga sp. Cy-1792]NIG57091.1 hypothetical protein [Chitinophaga sp. Cy-1792]